MTGQGVLARDAEGWKIEDLRFNAWLSVVERRSAELRDIFANQGFDRLVSRLDRQTRSVLDRPEGIETTHLDTLQSDERPLYPLPLPIP